MLKKSKKGYYFWDEFSKFGVVNGFSTNTFGDMSRNNDNWKVNLDKFCKALGIDKNKTISMEQVHGDKVYVASRTDLGKVKEKVDGLISNQKDVFLLCKVADCVPILLFDKSKRIFAIVHAGWKGTYNEIVKVVISKMTDLGSSAKNIMVGIGPSIMDCCYSINKDRSEIFASKFQKWKNEIIKKKDIRYFLSLQNLIKLQMIKYGISKTNIYDCMIYTKDNSTFYSFRNAENKNSFDRFIGIIGVR